MFNPLNSGNSSLERAAARVQAKREAERAKAPTEATPIGAPLTTTTQVRARLNVIPGESALADMVAKALTALARGVRWARGSIINLIV